MLLRFVVDGVSLMADIMRNFINYEGHGKQICYVPCQNAQFGAFNDERLDKQGTPLLSAGKGRRCEQSCVCDGLSAQETRCPRL